MCLRFSIQVFMSDQNLNFCALKMRMLKLMILIRSFHSNLQPIFNLSTLLQVFCTFKTLEQPYVFINVRPSRLVQQLILGNFRAGVKPETPVRKRQVHCLCDIHFLFSLDSFHIKFASLERFTVIWSDFIAYFVLIQLYVSPWNWVLLFRVGGRKLNGWPEAEAETTP